jgi:BirA family transcriptional regulator, biotin operon repressor / biotin---[acetyl-CoA-carboxylase] ligase
MFPHSRKMSSMQKRKIVRLKVTESTNSFTLDLANKGADTGTVVMADSQTGGRGRLNRSWLSPPGMGLYFSLLLKPDLAAENLPKITLAAGLAISKAVAAESAVSLKIKWPNDLILDNKKTGGILTETSAVQNLTGSRKTYVVIGVGLNIYEPEGGFPASLKDRATSLSLHCDREIVTEKLLERCIFEIEKVVRRMEEGDFPAILEEWKQLDALKDQELSWVTPQGRQVTGRSLGPDADGILHIREKTGIIHEVISGDVELVGFEGLR